MLVPIKWLKEYVKTDLSSDEISKTLTLAGLTIEDISNDVMDGEVTSNRPDWLSIYGVAREFAALTNSPIKKLEKPNFEIKNKEIIKFNLDNSLIRRFSGYVIQGITIKDSPEWLKSKLRAVNIRSINNIVDITNYIMIETGQPLHSFDCDKIKGDITLRRGKTGETIITLDQIKREVDENNLVAENNSQLIDLVGIMGGALSDTRENTKTVFIQAAVFPPTQIRKSSKTIKLSTEASYRYERGVDYQKNIDYLDRAVEMILDLAGGEVIQKIDIKPEEPKQTDVKWKLSDAESLIGIPIDETVAIKCLVALGIETKKENDYYISNSPSWRFDINIKEDIIEEIARFCLVNDMPRTQLPPVEITPQPSEYTFVESLKDDLVELGFTEIDGYSFLSAKNLRDAGLNHQDCLEASNPLSEEYQYLRPSLFPDILTAVAQNPSFSPITFFEFGHVFSTSKKETNHLGIIVATNKQDELKQYEDSINSWFKNDKAATFIQVEAKIKNPFKIRKSFVSFLELDIKNLREIFKDKNKFLIPKMDNAYTTVSRFPSITRDLAFIVDKAIVTEDVKNFMSTNSNLSDRDETVNIRAELFDEFASDKFGKDKKSLAFHINYQSDNRTLTNEEIEGIHQSIIDELKQTYQAQPRI